MTGVWWPVVAVLCSVIGLTVGFVLGWNAEDD